MISEQLFDQYVVNSAPNPLETPIAVDQTKLGAGISMHGIELNTAEKATSKEFSIDELREIARQFGVPDRASITERERLVEAIRRRI